MSPFIQIIDGERNKSVTKRISESGMMRMEASLILSGDSLC